MKNTKIKALYENNRENLRTIEKWWFDDLIYYFLIGFAIIGWTLVRWSELVEADKLVYSSQICTTDKCKARIERINNCKGDVKCAVNLTQEASYDHLYKEISKLKEIAVEGKRNVFSLDKLAYAVAMQETKDCTLGYWKTHNNCFWIKHWNTVPCPWVPKMAMCKFKTKEESYRAFKIIWTKWYWELPNYEMAKRWSWDDRAWIWKYNVLHFYNK